MILIWIFWDQISPQHDFRSKMWVAQDFDWRISRAVNERFFHEDRRSLLPQEESLYIVHSCLGRSQCMKSTELHGSKTKIKARHDGFKSLNIYNQEILQKEYTILPDFEFFRKLLSFTKTLMDLVLPDMFLFESPDFKLEEIFSHQQFKLQNHLFFSYK